MVVGLDIQFNVRIKRNRFVPLVIFFDLKVITFLRKLRFRASVWGYF